MLAIMLVLATSISLIEADGPLEASGWVLERTQPSDAFIVKNGILELGCSKTGVNKGLSYFREVPFCTRGEYSFEIRLDPAAVKQNRINLWLTVGDISFVFRKDGVQRYIPALEPRWQNVCARRYPANQWVRFRLVWNGDQKIVKWYCGDMRIPAKIEKGISICSVPQTELRLGIRNYGLLESDITDYIRDLRYAEITWNESAERERDSVLVFRGLMDEEFPINRWSADFDKEHRYDFIVEFIGSNIRSLNSMQLSAVPDDEVWSRAKRILLVDMPLVYRTFSEGDQNMLMEAVKDGAELVVTDGPLALEKCGNYNSPIVKALPVSFSDPWTPVSSARIVRRDFGKGKIILVNRKGRNED